MLKNILRNNIFRCNAAGFSLLEVLLAIFILSLAVLAAVGMQTAAMRRINDAYWQSVAATQVANMAECIHTSSVTNCLANWNQQNAALLPDGIGTCKQNSASYKISVCWTPHLALVKKNCVDMDVANK